MDLQSLLIMAIVGIVAGFLAGLVVKGHGFGLIGNLIVGIIGAFLAGYLLPMLHISFSLGNALVTQIVYAAIGAVVLLFVIGLFKRS